MENFVFPNKMKTKLKMYELDVGRIAHQASPIRFESLRLLHDPYTLPAGNPIDP